MVVFLLKDSDMLFRNEYRFNRQLRIQSQIKLCGLALKTHTLFHEARPLFIQEVVGVLFTTYVIAYLILHYYTPTIYT